MGLAGMLLVITSRVASNASSDEIGAGAAGGDDCSRSRSA